MSDPSTAELLAAIQRIARRDRPVVPTDRLIADLHLDDLQLFQLACHLESIRPGCRIPSQMDVEDVSVADLDHFLHLPHPTG